MTKFEQRTSGDGIGRSANSAKATALILVVSVCTNCLTGQNI